MAKLITGESSARGRRSIRLAMDAAVAFSGIAAIAALVLEYGFRERLVPLRTLHVVASVVVAVFIVHRVMGLLLAGRRWEYLRQNMVDFVLIVVALIVLAIGLGLRGNVLSAGALYVLITQVYILVALLIRGVNMNLRFAGSGIHPTWLLIGSFAFLCLAGSALLMLPVAVREGEYDRWFYPDALFTAVSAACVTGLVVQETGRFFTAFGQAVILALIQVGGLGIMMFGTVLAMLVGKGLSVKTSGAIGQMLATERVGELRRTLSFVVLVTLVFEAVGAVLLYPMFRSAPDSFGQPMVPALAVWYSVFHSISAFCNAGFSLYKDNMMEPVNGGGLRQYWQVIGVMAPLIVIGGLGFPVLQDCARWLLSRARVLVAALASHRDMFNPVQKARLSLHSKLVLTTSAALIVFGALGLVLVEKLPGRPGPRVEQTQLDSAAASADPAALRDLRGGELVREAVFQSVSARTAGFNTVDMGELSNPGKLWMCGLMTIGGSPASTAGGMKTATFAMLVVATWCMLRRRSEVEVFHRSLSTELVYKAVAVAALYLLMVAAVTLLVSVGMKKSSLIDVLFEACSACGTVGLSTGLTGKLTLFPKCVIIAGMYIGRVGPLTLLLALVGRMRHVRYAYPTENVVIG